MEYHFAQHLLVRTPVKIPADHNAGIQTFLNESSFRTAVKIATPAFYEVLVRKHFDAEQLSEKETLTVQKYVNRYCFRPTPFALFSSVSLGEWEGSDSTHVYTGKLSAYITPAMTIQHMLGSRLLENLPKDAAKFESNHSIYHVLNEYRFFRTGLDETGSRRDYQLQSIAFSRVLKDLLRSCEGGMSRESIVRQIARSAACTNYEAMDYAEFLIDAQLLISTDRMTITGEDHLIPMAEKLPVSPEKKKILKLLTRLSNRQQSISTEFLEQLEKEVQDLTPGITQTPDKFNVILTRDGAAPPLELQYQDKLSDGIAALELFSAPAQTATMAQFVKSFQQYFEGQTLPLLLALDPEAGVGYQHPETEKDNPLLETLNIPYAIEPKSNVTWSQVNSVLLECWLRGQSGARVVTIEQSDLELLQSNQPREKILGMSVLFRIAENKVFIENAGGNNAPALMGRFTIANEEIAQSAITMARDLEKANPDIIFAELLHLADPHTDNINRRAHIYRYELPITAASSLPTAYQIRLSDLYVRIINNQAVLFSMLHEKIVIPRLTSAYNHSLDKLPLFRFLADLSYQYVRSNLGLNLRQLFPDLHYYPRVEYKEAILCLAMWILTEKQVQDLVDSSDIRKSFDSLSSKLQLPRYFSLAEGDQELVFDGLDNSDVQLFAKCLRQNKEIVLKEFLDQPVVRQYNAFLLPDEALIFPELPPPGRSKRKVRRKYMPGSSWLYLKIYAPRISADRLLLRIAPLINKRYGGNRISQWFFIRYEDHAPHIRLRMQVNPDLVSEILAAFKSTLEDRVQQHVIREFQIDVYSRELERYAAGGIENAEGFFWASSELVLHFLKRKKVHTSTHVFALCSAFNIISALIPDRDDQISFAWSSFQQFLPEFGDRTFNVDLDKKYRELRPDISAAFKGTDVSLYSGSRKAGRRFEQTLQVIKRHLGTTTDTAYVRSLIHMHLNRTFVDESRKQEMICYYFLHKYLLSEKGRNNRKNS